MSRLLVSEGAVECTLALEIDPDGTTGVREVADNAPLIATTDADGAGKLSCENWRWSCAATYKSRSTVLGI